MSTGSPTDSGRCAPHRPLLLRFSLGRGPLKRRSDRLEAASRLMVALALLIVLPVALGAGTAVSHGLSATAAQQAATRAAISATLLHDAAPQAPALARTVETSATWLAPDGSTRVGTVPAVPGAPAGTAVRIWMDRSGRPVPSPLADRSIAAQALVAGVVSGLGLLVAACSVHLIVVWLLGRRRDRQWTAEWARVEPLWLSRFR